MWYCSELDSSKSIHAAVLEALGEDIGSGKLQPGERMPTQRQLANMINASLGTANRIYREAERRGWLTAVVGRGTFVTAGANDTATMSGMELSPLSLDLGFPRPMSQGDPMLLTVAKKVFSKSRQSKLASYVSPRGFPGHRAIGADWLSRFGLKVPPKNVVITAGAQHALYIICNFLFNKTDCVATDHLTTMGFKAAAQYGGVRLEGLAMDSEGMLPDELDALCSRRAIRGVYVSGRLQEPTNAVMSSERRKALAEVIRRRGLLLVENDANSALSPTPEATLTCLLPEQSVYISSFTNIFLANLRVAFVTAPEHLIKDLARGVADTMICVPPLCADIMAENIGAGHVDETIERKRFLLSRRVAAFRKIFQGHEHTCLDWSIRAWLHLPPPIKAAMITREADRRNILLLSPERFAVGPVPLPEAIPVCLTGVPEMKDLQHALRTLERVISNSAKLGQVG